MKYIKYVDKENPSEWAVYQIVPRYKHDGKWHNEILVCGSSHGWPYKAFSDESFHNIYDISYIDEEELNNLKVESL